MCPEFWVHINKGAALSIFLTQFEILPVTDLTTAIDCQVRLLSEMVSFWEFHQVCMSDTDMA